MPVIFCLVRQFFIYLFAEVVICSSLQRLENDFTIISKGTFGLFSTSLLWLLDSSPLLSWDFQRTFLCLGSISFVHATMTCILSFICTHSSSCNISRIIMSCHIPEITHEIMLLFDLISATLPCIKEDRIFF